MKAAITQEFVVTRVLIFMIIILVILRYGGTVIESGIEQELGSDWELRDIVINNSNNDVKEYGFSQEICNVIQRSRVCRITLRKENPGSSIIVWWSRVFENNDEETPIDTTTIKDRKSKINSSNNSDIWNEANKMFQQRVEQLQQQKQIVNETILNDA